MCVCISVGLLANLWTDFDEIFWRGRPWKDQVIQFWWRSGSRFGSGSPKSKVRNPDPPDRRRFVLSECSFLVVSVFCVIFVPQSVNLTVSLFCGTWPNLEELQKRSIKQNTVAPQCILVTCFVARHVYCLMHDVHSCLVLKFELVCVLSCRW